MTGLGIIIAAAGAALIWAGITDTALGPEIRAALGRSTNADKLASGEYVKVRKDGSLVLPGDKDQSGDVMPKSKAVRAAVERSSSR